MSKLIKIITLLNFFRAKEKERASFTFQEAADKTGLSQLSNNDFIRLKSQSITAKTLTLNERIYHKLIRRILDVFTLALDVYNRPNLSNRVEAFTIMMVNAWELFLKAEILDTLGQERVFYSHGKNISISDALPLCLQSNDPVKKNIKILIQLRDHATHPYTTKSAINKINNAQSTVNITSSSFQAVPFKHKIKENNNPELHNYTDIHPYSTKFIN